MNTERFKFRAWDLIEHRFIKRDNFQLSWNGDVSEYFYKRGGSDYGTNDDVILEQFTGLKDKNNKEIYEGDVVKQRFNEEDNPNSLSTNMIWSKSTWKVDWFSNQHRFGLQELNSKYGNSGNNEYLPVGEISNDIEIVGNIHESSN